MFYKRLITIMKKNIWIWALAATFMVACSSKDDEPTIEQPITENDFESPNGQVVIQLGGGEYSASASTTVTRTPVTDANFIGTNVGIFALATTNGTDNNATDWSTAEGALLNNIQGVVSTQTNTLGSEANTKKISLYRGGASGAVYYYPMDNKFDYTFYGYSPYQTTATVTASQATVSLTFNGSQDIMWQKAAAPNIPEQSIFIDETTDDKNTSVLTGYKAKYIRQLKYHHDIITNHGKTGTDYTWVPNINFEHQLTQFTFQVIAAKKQSSEDKTEAQKLKVKDVKLKGHGTSATMNILTGALTWTNNEDLSMLTIDTDNPATGTFTPSIAENGGDKVGYLMAKPTDGATPLTLEVTVEAPTPQVGGTNIPAEQTIAILLNTAGGFKKGIIYNVQIGVYAMQEVMVDATLTEWKDFDGGNIDAPVE